MNPIESLSFYELMRSSHIKRWTIINTTREQNLAEHQYNVAVIGLELMRLAGLDVNVWFILSLMFHDAPEIRYGDVPTPGKSFIRAATGMNDIFRVLDNAIMPELPFAANNPQQHSSLEGKIVKLADLIETAWFIRENGAGHHASVVADKCWSHVVSYVHDHELYDIVDSVLADLGLPRINKSERLTPS